MENSIKPPKKMGRPALPGDVTICMTVKLTAAQAEFYRKAHRPVGGKVATGIRLVADREKALMWCWADRGLP